jgi:hypothetical protein
MLIVLLQRAIADWQLSKTCSSIEIKFLPASRIAPLDPTVLIFQVSILRTYLIVFLNICSQHQQRIGRTSDANPEGLPATS